MEICSKLKIVLEDNGSTDYSLFMTNNVVAENKKILQLVSHSIFMKRIEASMLQQILANAWREESGWRFSIPMMISCIKGDVF